MPAYNFKPRFAELVESGKKCQTIGCELSMRRWMRDGSKSRRPLLIGSEGFVR